MATNRVVQRASHRMKGRRCPIGYGLKYSANAPTGAYAQGCDSHSGLAELSAVPPHMPSVRPWSNDQCRKCFTAITTTIRVTIPINHPLSLITAGSCYILDMSEEREKKPTLRSANGLLPARTAAGARAYERDCRFLSFQMLRSAMFGIACPPAEAGTP